MYIYTYKHVSHVHIHVFVHIFTYTYIDPYVHIFSECDLKSRSRKKSQHKALNIA